MLDRQILGLFAIEEKQHSWEISKKKSAIFKDKKFKGVIQK